MNTAQIVRRETAISVVINTVLGAAFFVALFGVAQPAPVRGIGAYAFDFLPQSFMVALMSSLVPGLMTASRAGLNGRRAIAARSFMIALLAAALLGGGAMSLFYAAGLDRIGPWVGLAIKMAFGAVEAAILTPLAVRHALARPSA